MFIGVPSSGRTVDIRWALNFHIVTMNVPVGSHSTVMMEISPDRALNREVLAQAAIDAGARYLFMMDDDTCCPNYTLRYLSYEIEKHPDIMVCGGIYTTKEFPPRPLVFKKFGDGSFWNWKAGEVFDCEGLGTGCMLIKTEVFKHITKPWFLEPNEAPENESRLVGDKEIQIGHRSGTDDLYFCRKVIDAGYRIVAHGGVLCEHIAQNGVIFKIPEDSYPMRKEEMEIVA